MKQLTHLLPPCIKHQFGINENSAPRTSNDKHSRTRITSRTNTAYSKSLIDNIQITLDDIEGDLHEGRD